MAHTDLQQPASPMSALAWGVLVIRGIVAIIIGLVAILWPEVTLMGLVKLLGVYAFVSGIFTGLVGAIWPPGWGVRRLMVLQGVLGTVNRGCATHLARNGRAGTTLRHRCLGHSQWRPRASGGHQIA
jgi:uncharacterized membrane protein HdeD (DUF308 family)